MRYKTIILLFLFLFLFTAVEGEGFSSYLNSEIPLIVWSGHFEGEWLGQEEYEEWRRPVEINSLIFRYGSVKAGDKLLVELRQGEMYTIEITRSALYGEAHAIAGKVEGFKFGSFYLSHHNGELLGSIEIADLNEMYGIMYDSSTGRHYLRELNPHKLDILEEAPSLLPDTGDLMELGGVKHRENNLGEQKIFEQQYRVTNPILIDVMIVYTPAADNWASNINNVIANAMIRKQDSIDNSDLNIEMRLVYSSLVDYTESHSFILDLCRITATPTYIHPYCSNNFPGQVEGYMDEVHDWRDISGADLVALFPVRNDVGGVAWLMPNPGGLPHLGFSLTRVQQAGNSYTHAHEVGHNMGNHHSRWQNSNPAPPSGGLFEYSTGWRWIGTDSQGYVSVMTYTEGDLRVPIFSNPDIDWQGTPTGSYDPNNQYTPADNARSMSEIKEVIADYMPAVDTIPPDPVTDLLIADVTNESVVLTWTATGANGDIGRAYKYDLRYSTEPINDENFEDAEQATESSLPLPVGELEEFEVSGLDDNTTYYFALKAANIWLNWSEMSNVTSTTTVSVEEEDELAYSYFLGENYPNPFNPSTVIRYGLPERSVVRLEVYNVLGQRVATLVDTEMNAGYHEVVWHSEGASSGIYFYRLEAVSADDPSNMFVQVRSMLYLK